MASVAENSPWPPRPSNRTIELLLQLAVEVCGAERAFLVGVGEDDALELLLHSSRRADGRVSPSRSILRRVVAGAGPVVCPDLSAERDLAGAPSVRALRLRSLLAAPVGHPTNKRAALVLDSRYTASAPSPHLIELVRAFATVLGLALDGRGKARSRTASTGPEHESIAGRSEAIRALRAWVRRVAACELPVLIQGETGSGKETVARRLHRLSPRRDGPFVAVNCTALSETLLDAELFGSSRGAYTGSDRDRPGLFRAARGGTLLLDEVGDMSRAMQAKLLRALQEKTVRPVGTEREIPVDARVVAATHRDLGRMASAGEFRTDLYHRLAVLVVHVPPLREHMEDLAPLVEHLAPGLVGETGCPPPRLSGCAWDALRSHDWPGNVRELRSVLARAMLRTGGEPIRARHLALPEPTGVAPAPMEPIDPKLERSMIVTALARAGGNLSEAARRIGWTRQKVYRRMRALGIDRGPRSGRVADQEGTTSSESSTFQ